MKRKMSNMTKDKVRVSGCLIFILAFIVLLIYLGFAVVHNLFAENIVEELTQSQINKYYTEQSIKNEIEYLAMWEYTENMSEQEYYDTFFKNDCAEYEYVMKKEKEEVKKCQKN